MENTKHRQDLWQRAGQIAFILFIAGIAVSMLGRNVQAQVAAKTPAADRAETANKSVAQSEPRKRPNIVLFFVDDLGWTDVGFNGSKYESPNIDQLASEGMRFEQAYVASPTCSPSRATLVTGKHPARLRMVRHIPTGSKNKDFDEFGRTDEEFNLWPGDPAKFPCRNWLPLEHTTYAEALNEQGYYSLFVGKWHLGHDEYHPIRQGFDRQIGTTNWGHPKSYRPPFFQGSDVFAGEQDRYLTDRLADETVRFINEYDSDKPFMISNWFYNVHAPHIGRLDLLDYFSDQGFEGKELHYAAMIKSVDEAVGRIRAALIEKGVAEQTVVILTSDQGSWFENPPFRGSKRVDTLCEAGARVPMVIRWPGVTKAGAVSQDVVQTTDLFPTLVEISGGEPAAYAELDGISLLPALKGDQLQRGKPIFGYRAYQDLYASVREGPWKLLAYRSGKVHLYQVTRDRYEQRDLAASHPDIVKRLRNKLVDWEKSMGVQQYSGVQ